VTARRVHRWQRRLVGHADPGQPDLVDGPSRKEPLQTRAQIHHGRISEHDAYHRRSGSARPTEHWHRCCFGCFVMTSSPTTLLLPEHHRRLEEACTELLGVSHGDDTRALGAAWRRFEAEVLDHLAAEEEVMLPAYEEVAPAAAHEIRDDHARIRALLTTLGLEVELHVIRAETVRWLVDALRDHARREDETMYVWARRSLPPHGLAALYDRIVRWLR